MFINHLKRNTVSRPDDRRQDERAGGSDRELMGGVTVSRGVERDHGRDAEEDRRTADVAMPREWSECRGGHFGEPRQKR